MVAIGSVVVGKRRFLDQLQELSVWVSVLCATLRPRCGVVSSSSSRAKELSALVLEGLTHIRMRV